MIAIAAGCAPAQPAVFVDLQAVAEQQEGISPGEGKSIRAARSGPSTGSLESYSQSGLAEDTFTARRKAARESIQRERQKIFEELSQYYYQDLERKLNAIRSELLESARARGKELDVEFATKFSEMTLKSSRERAPIVIRIELNQIAIGDEHGRVRDIPLEKGLSRRLTDERTKLKSDLLAVDAKFDEEVQAIVESNNATLLRERTEIMKTIEGKRAELDSEIRSLINEKLGPGNGLDLPPLLEDAGTKGSDSPAVSQGVPGLTAAPESLGLSSRGPLSRTDLEKALNIWADVHGYKLVSGRDQGTDRTAEFIDWLNKK